VDRGASKRYENLEKYSKEVIEGKIPYTLRDDDISSIIK
jgi:hypothetical protein